MTLRAVKALVGDILSQITFKQNGTGAVTRPALSKMQEQVSPQDFGAVGDGVTDDTLAMQRFFNYLASSGKEGYGVGEFLLTSPIVLTSPAKPFTFRGADGATIFKFRLTAAGNGFNIVNMNGTLMEDFIIDLGFAETGFGSHTMAIRNPNDNTIRNVYSKNYSLSGGIMFADTVNMYVNNHFIECTADGMGTGQNGLLLVDMLYSTLESCTALNLSTTGSPCYGLQLKNECKHSQIIDGYASGCKGGIVFASDAVLGPSNCFASGLVSNCDDGLLIGKTSYCQFDVEIDGITGSNAVELGADCLHNSVGVTINNVDPALTAILVRSDDNTIHVKRAANFGAKLLEMTAGVDRCRLIIDDLGGNITNPFDYITDNSGTTTNNVFYTHSVRNNLYSGSPIIFFQTPGVGTTYLAATNSNGNFNFRSLGVDRLFIQPTTINPGQDNAYQCGVAARRWSELFSANGTINTSDARHKTEVVPLTEAELRAARRIGKAIGVYRWLQSIDEKGDEARRHVGLTVQEAIEILEDEGVDPFSLGFICYDKWDDAEAVIGPDGIQISPKVVGGDLYSFRMDELMAFCVRGLIETQELQEKRLIALESKP